MLPGSCHGPIWRVDDFSTCFERDYLQIIFPVLLCALSVAALVRQAVRKPTAKLPAGYATVPADDSIQDVVTGGLDDNAVVDDASDSSESIQPVAPLRRSLSGTLKHHVTVDRPAAQLWVLLLEEAAVLGVFVINVLSLVSGKSIHGRKAAIVGVATWGYIFVLASARLLLSKKTVPLVAKLWGHTAWLYLTNFVLAALLFRSAIIHPASDVSQKLTIVYFALVTTLALIVLSVRKGNRTVLLETVDGIQPSREQLASLLSLSTFSWVDNIVWKGYKKGSLDIEDVWNLVPSDKAVPVLHAFRQTLRQYRLVWRLLGYFRWMLPLQAVWSALGAFCSLMPTLFLRSILRYIENPGDTPKNAVWFYIILVFVFTIAEAVSEGQALWIGRKICIRLRAIIIGEVYGKALRRKASAQKDTVLGAKKEDPDEKPSWWRRLLCLGRKKKTDKPDSENPAESSAEDESQANTGTITNLMSVDSFKVSESSSYLHYIWAQAPIQIGIASYLLWSILGWSSIAGILSILALLPTNVFFAHQFNKIQKQIMAATDIRVHKTNEVMTNIRIIKYFAWEQRFSLIVDEPRQTELKRLRKRYLIWAFSGCVYFGAPVIITLASFFFYTIVEGKQLLPSVAFTSISLFNILRGPLDQLAYMIAEIQEAKVSVDRVEEFLAEEETEKYNQLEEDLLENDDFIGFKEATFTWGSKASASSADQAGSNEAFRLLDLDVEFPIGKLSLVVGPTGSGKTSILMALLGEMTLLDGRVILPGGKSREDVPVDPKTGYKNCVAYCAQSAWLVNDTIRENILFDSPWNSKRYKQVIAACSLERDLEILEAGDQTLVGEKGITLSGGQKQRVSLARAIYSQARHILLDDCLSAVDSHTAKWIFESALQGPLMSNRTCVLVTHNVALTITAADFVVVLENGRVTAQGKSDAVIASGVLGDDVKSATNSAQASRLHSRAPSEDGDAKTHDEDLKRTVSTQSEVYVKGKKLIDEEKAVGGVKLAVIKMYLLSMGGWAFWIFVAFLFMAQEFTAMAPSIWVAYWADNFQSHQNSTTSSDYRIKASHNFITSENKILNLGGCLGNIECLQNLFSTGNIKPQKLHSNAEVGVGLFLGVYALLGLVYVCFAFLRELSALMGSVVASRRIHDRLLNAVLRARFKFFDSTPLGQIMNRFSKDIESVDQEVAPTALGALSCLVSIVGIIILVSIITPGFLLGGVVISVLYFLTGRFYLSSSRDLKRLESVQRSPLYQQFGETLSGITTIRAYGDQRRFIRDNESLIDTQNRPFIFLWAANRWLAFRIDFIGGLVFFFAALFVMLNVENIDAGKAGLSLTYAIGFTQNVLWLVRLYSQNEQNMNSVERIKEYIDVEQEAPAKIPENAPPSDWPSKGAVKFVDYSTRYRQDLDLVLKQISIDILPQEKVGVVGRTGAGKSSLALALFRGLEADTGRILIDDIDIARIGLQDLRESVTMVPQDPTLFTGTIRSNLDPFGIFTDDEVFAALRKVQLIDTEAPLPVPPIIINEPVPSGTVEVPISSSSTQTAVVPQYTNKNIFRDLSSAVTESGNNLSQGQKQLLCLARALLRSPKVILMDEATASIDYATDAKIQGTIRELTNTIITIAHRLNTIIDYDKVLVLDHGKVVEYGAPWELIEKEEGIFKGMCEMSGDFDTLKNEAKKAAKKAGAA